jgi:hypothetical protein
MVGFHEQDSRDLGKKQVKTGKSAKPKPSRLHQPPKQPKLKCPQCGSERLYKDGMRYLSDGESVQRWLCRNCYYRFSQPRKQNKPSQKPSEWQINTASGLFLDCQERGESRKRRATTLQAGGTSLVTSETRQETAQREGTETSKQLAQILNYALQAKKRGLAESIIKQRVYRLKHLVREGANLNDPDSVCTILATRNWSESNKRVFIVAYQSFAKTYKLQWEKPKTRVERKLPFIPTEEEIDQLIAGCGKKTATFLQVLKDIGARTAEASRIQ